MILEANYQSLIDDQVLQTAGENAITPIFFTPFIPAYNRRLNLSVNDFIALEVMGFSRQEEARIFAGICTGWDLYITLGPQVLSALTQRSNEYACRVWYQFLLNPRVVELEVSRVSGLLHSDYARVVRDYGPFALNSSLSLSS